MKTEIRFFKNYMTLRAVLNSKKYRNFLKKDCIYQCNCGDSAAITIIDEDNNEIITLVECACCYRESNKKL